MDNKHVHFFTSMIVLEAVLRFMRQEEFYGPVNIGSEEMVTINQLAEMALEIADKKERSYIKNIAGEEFQTKYGFKCPVGVRGRNSDNKLYKEKMGWEPTKPLYEGMKKHLTGLINKYINEKIYSYNNN
jgi:GDP-D-mannose 3',5'-epimerase